MPKLQYGKNYIGILIVLIAVIFVMTVITGEIYLEALPFFLFFMICLELYSGVGLNNSWTAVYTKTERPFLFYTGIILYLVFGIALLFIFHMPSSQLHR